MSMHVKHPRHGMDTTQCWPRETRTNYACERATPQSAWIGSELEVAPATNMTTDTLALDATKPRILCLSSSAESLKHLLPTIQTFGSVNYKKQDSQENIHMLWQAYVSTSPSIFPRSLPPKYLLIIIPSLSMQKNSPELLVRKSRRNATLD